VCAAFQNVRQNVSSRWTGMSKSTAFVRSIQQCDRSVYFKRIGEHLPFRMLITVHVILSRFIDIVPVYHLRLDAPHQFDAYLT